MSTGELAAAPNACGANRCEGCLTPASLWSLERLRREFPNLHLDDTGHCGRCGATDEVYDVANLIMLRWHGVLDIGTAYPPQRLRVAHPGEGTEFRNPQQILKELTAAGFSPRPPYAGSAAHDH